MSEISFGRYTSVLYRYNQIIINHLLKPYGFGSGQYLFLLSISNHKGVSQKDLTDHMNVDKATTAKALSKLEKLGFIIRTKDETDRRFYKIYLSEKGIRFMPTLRAHLHQVSEIITKGMNEEQLHQTKELFELMIQNAIQEVEQLK
ncbi:MAG: MarR family transcriptional regulator [Vallitaleaceae bacterium]|nr:MarR family transcriptional regulator [Vallitaleaceae bacterium]